MFDSSASLSNLAFVDVCLNDSLKVTGGDERCFFDCFSCYSWNKRLPPHLMLVNQTSCIYVRRLHAIRTVDVLFC